MKDVQNQIDRRNLPLKKVGIKNLSYPITVLDKAKNTQKTIANIELYASLPHNFKGTHMSRFVEVFHKYANDIRMPNFLLILHAVRQALHSKYSSGVVRFPYFLQKSAPVSRQSSMLQYECAFSGIIHDTREHFFVMIKVPITLLCPCSKEISDRGAHNQRGYCTVSMEVDTFFWIEDLIVIVENTASSDLYTLLKRQDEKHVTEHAYDNPMFVEDMVREVTRKLQAAYTFPWFLVEVSSEESIHTHNAYACAEKGNSPLDHPFA